MNCRGSAGAYLVSSADKVHATQGLAGGIVGVSEGSIRYAASRCGSVQADEGEAGGITGVNRAGQGNQRLHQLWNRNIQ